MNSAPSATPWLPGWQPNPAARVRLFVFPYAGGSTASFRNWKRLLGDDVDFCPVQLPGRAGRIREAPPRRLDPLVATLEELLAPYLDLPFALFGHSLGALVAFELARSLRRRGTPAAHLLVSGRRAPQLPPPGPTILDLSDDEFVARLREMNGTPDEIMQDEELMRVVLPTLRADFEVNDTYTYREDGSPGCPVTVYGGTADPEATYAELAAWRAHADAGFTLTLFPGDHFFLHAVERQLLLSVAERLAGVGAAPA